jgi:hypothetical protein
MFYVGAHRNNLYDGFLYRCQLYLSKLEDEERGQTPPLTAKMYAFHLLSLKKSTLSSSLLGKYIDGHLLIRVEVSVDVLKIHWLLVAR